MLFRKNVAKFCAYCVHAGQANNGQMLCRKKGFVNSDSKCWRFRYDPLKRTPSRYQAKDFSQFDDRDFSL
ncbi:MAG: hypothetical protein IKP19_08545 [Oscillospiraceae bacterium]|nr:hypothetical protein [Oscillospiraceae bacterium]